MQSVSGSALGSSIEKSEIAADAVDDTKIADAAIKLEHGAEAIAEINAAEQALSWNRHYEWIPFLWSGSASVTTVSGTATVDATNLDMQMQAGAGASGRAAAILIGDGATNLKPFGIKKGMYIRWTGLLNSNTSTDAEAGIGDNLAVAATGNRLNIGNFLGFLADHVSDAYMKEVKDSTETITAAGSFNNSAAEDFRVNRNWDGSTDFLIDNSSIGTITVGPVEPLFPMAHATNQSGVTNDADADIDSVDDVGWV